MVAEAEGAGEGEEEQDEREVGEGLCGGEKEAEEKAEEETEEEGGEIHRWGRGKRGEGGLLVRKGWRLYFIDLCYCTLKGSDVSRIARGM